MKIALIQLSDIHLKLDAGDNPILERADALARAVAAVCFGVDYGVLVVSGDTAHSGKDTEYQHGRRLIDTIRSGLLGDLFRSVEVGLPRWGTAIKGHLEEQDEDPTALNILDAFNRFLVSLLQMVGFVIFKYVSESVGTQKVAPTFAEIAAEDKNASIKVIDLAIRLDHYDQFPKAAIEELARLFAKNPFALGVVRYLVWHRLYLYTVDFKIQQSVCDTLGIPIEGQVRMLSAAMKRVTKDQKGRK